MKRILLATLAVPFALVGMGSSPAAAAPPVDQAFTITVDLANPGAPGAAVGVGAINETGTYTTTAHRVAGRTSHDLGTITLADGTLEVKSASVWKHRAVDTETCTSTETGKGVWKFNKGHGTGMYAASKGHGRFTYSGTSVGVSDGNGGCDFSAATGSVTISATGKVKLA